jgi:hypothetical protein
MIALAREYLQAEKNSPLPTKRNSVFCQRRPANQELNGLFLAHGPANEPDVFFDPALGKSVMKRSQPNTQPFGGAAARSSCGSHTPAFLASSTIASSESLVRFIIPCRSIAL